MMFVAGTSYSQTPRGNRVLGLDVNPYDNQLPSSNPYSGAAADAVAQGVTTVSLHLKWNQIESSPGVFAGPDATNWMKALANGGGFYVDFLALPLASDYYRDGKRKATKEVAVASLY